MPSTPCASFARSGGVTAVPHSLRDLRPRQQGFPAINLGQLPSSTRVLRETEQKKALATKDPLAVYDGFIESLERQGAEVRKSAATLLALRGDLPRDVEKYDQRSKDLSARVRTAEAKGEARASKTLRRDLEEAQNMREQSEKALVTAKEDAQLLLAAATDNASRAAELKSPDFSHRVLHLFATLHQAVSHPPRPKSPFECLTGYRSHFRTHRPPRLTNDRHDRQVVRLVGIG